MQKCPNFFISLPALVSFRLLVFNTSHPNGYELDSHWRFDLRSLMTKDVEYLFMCLLANYISPLEKCLYISFSPFQIGLSFCCWILDVFWILDPRPLPDVWIANIPPIFWNMGGRIWTLPYTKYSVGYLFNLLIVFIEARIFKILMKSELIYFSFFCCLECWCRT